MATATRRRGPHDFDIHEDGPSTEDTEMNTDALGEDAEVDEDAQEGAPQHEQEQEQDLGADQETEQDQDEGVDEEDEDDMSEEEVLDEDMRKLQDAFPSFRRKYRLIKRIGEGTRATNPRVHP